MIAISTHTGVDLVTVHLQTRLVPIAIAAAQGVRRVVLIGQR
jgi:hypothetical protein